MTIRHIYGNLYEADYESSTHSKQVIYFITENNRVLLIDTGYEAEMEQLKAYFYEKSMIIDKVIITHYHEDHFSGLKALKKSVNNITVLGSSEYKRTLEIEYPDDFLHDSDIYPTVFCDNYEFRYGGHTIRFEKAPGHSYCSVHTIIDDSYVHVGDNLLFDTMNKAMLPLPYMSINEHIRTLEQLKGHLDKYFLGSHFSFEINKLKNRETEIDGRIAYLKLIPECNSNVEYDSIKDLLPIEFNPRWHNLILRFCEEQRAQM
ncbi:MBL fold metallo-hydrolase [Anaerocolumna jejuensis]|uniref:MBL fold metallo-hydrolase n=1 Tax=Anaerocolumna jejuensis TaxID=259063 RepID=UPI003F7BFB62